MYKKLRVMVFMFALLFLVTGCGSSKVVATVNGENINQVDLEKKVDLYKSGLEKQGTDFSGEKGEDILDSLRQNVLKQMIDEKILMQKAKDKELLPSQQEINKRIEEIKKRFKSEGEYKKYLTANGLNEPQLEEYIRKQLVQQNLFMNATGEVKVENNEVEEYYQENKKSFTQPEKRKVRHILIRPDSDKESSAVDAKIKAMQVINEIQNGADFARLAKKKSEDTGTKDNGGLMTITRGQGLGETFDDNVFSLKNGEITQDPVKTMYGYHIIKVEEIIPSQVKPFSEVKEQIKNQLQNQYRSKEFSNYMKKIRDEAKINNKLTHKNDSTSKK
ncbi:MAG: peptidylprolyl isomerase [Clostridiales bacterium]|nr:peptidylprolyl isomerase [Clostridiales bacterium]MCF8021573.1 peptidylprolyl isomerase [Clostridiales bacterium]